MNTEKIGIVGQGLAGSVLALQLISRGHSLVVYDQEHHRASSMVAAGMFNPIVFRKMNKSWRVDELLPAMNSFYTYWEQQWSVKWLHHLPIARVFPDMEQVNDWSARELDDRFSDYVGSIADTPIDGLSEPFGHGLVKGSGYLDVPGFLRDTRAYLSQGNALRNERFDHNELQADGQRWNYRTETFDRVIFCEGHQTDQNPWFTTAAYGNTKGEVMEVSIENFQRELIPNKGVWVLPVGGNRYRVGATFAWGEKSVAPTQEGRAKLEEQLQELLTLPYQIENHMAGIRPTTKDRRPVVETHPNFPNLHVLNGLGTKGVMIAPWLTLRAIDHFLQGAELPEEINGKRFTK
ncbi:MAG TPA: FAD-binding oxidoreductase [Luteibaculaceae bacterium]|nr:FAD-binding oxidoreductase [Luteibaculaceae bacterium]